MTVFDASRFSLPLPPGHRFPAGKSGLLRALLIDEGILAAADLEPAQPVESELLLLAHDPAYVAAVLKGRLDPAVERAIGLPWSPQLVQRSLASVGASLAAAEAALADGVGGALGGGTHHAGRSAGAGYCVFNDLAVVARHLLAQRSVGSVAIVDLDVHQGDGNGALLGDVAGVHLLDVFCEANYPVRKCLAGDTVALPAGTEDREYLDAVAAHLPLALGCDIVLYIAGVDPLVSDRLGRMRLSPAALQERDAMVLDACRARRVPVVITLGGGYSEPIALSVAAHAATYRTARRVFGRSAASAPPVC
jgi:acetoin utilization deacetylase AcuC-like enzyme